MGRLGSFLALPVHNFSWSGVNYLLVHTMGFINNNFCIGSESSSCKSLLREGAGSVENHQSHHLFVTDEYEVGLPIKNIS